MDTTKISLHIEVLAFGWMHLEIKKNRSKLNISCSSGPDGVLAESNECQIDSFELLAQVDKKLNQLLKGKKGHGRGDMTIFELKGYSGQKLMYKFVNPYIDNDITKVFCGLNNGIDVVISNFLNL